MYRRKGAADDMRRIYDVPPSYGGSRFIRATHGVRALSDGEFSSAPNAPGQKAGVPKGARPDFEYFGNAINAPGEKRAESGGAPTEGERRFPPDEAYRGDPGATDRYAHDFNARPDDTSDGVRDTAPNGGRAVGQRSRFRPSKPGGSLKGERPPKPQEDLHGDRPPRPQDDPNGERPPKPHENEPGGHRPPPAPLPKPDKPHGGDGSCDLSASDGDLLLLALLAFLAGEDNCADIIASLALLLAVR